MNDFEKTYELVHGEQRRLLKLRVRRRGGEWIAAAELETEGGPIRLIAAASEDTVRKMLERRRPQLTKTGDFLDVLKKITRSRALKSIFESVKSITRNPQIMQIAAAIPYVGTAMQGIKTAVDLTEKGQALYAAARAGHPRAIVAVKTIVEAAKGGNPAAKNTVRVLKAAMDRARELPAAADDAAGNTSPTRPRWHVDPEQIRALRMKSTEEFRPPVAAGAYNLQRSRWVEARPLNAFVTDRILGMIRSAQPGV